MENNTLSAVSDPALAYEFAVNKLKYELSQTMSRNNFFMVFQGVVLAGALGVNITEGSQAEWLWVIVSMLGMALSVLQFRMACAGRYQIVSAFHLVRARELDVIAAAPKDVPIYHFQTRACGTHKASYSSVNYKLVPPMWKTLGFKSDPQASPKSMRDKCNFIGLAILKWRVPSQIAIHVALVLLVFWCVVFILQFIELGSVPKISF